MTKKEAISMMNIAIEALSKSERKKPIIVDDSICCPNCKYEVMGQSAIHDDEGNCIGWMDVEYNYCPDCGQSIDWREYIENKYVKNGGRDKIPEEQKTLGDVIKEWEEAIKKRGYVN